MNDDNRVEMQIGEGVMGEGVMGEVVMGGGVMVEGVMGRGCNGRGRYGNTLSTRPKWLILGPEKYFSAL